MRQMVEKWIGQFKRDRTSTNDADQSGRLIDVTTSETIEKIHDNVLVNLEVKVREIAEAAGISIRSMVKILNEDLSMRKLTAKWVKCLLTIEQKRQRVRDSKNCL